MLSIAVEWFHDELNHPKYTTLIKSLKYHCHIWGVVSNGIKNLYTELNCEICLSNLTLPKKGHYKHIKTFAVFDRIQIDLTQIAFDDKDILSKKGYKWILTVIDCFSKFAWAFPLQSKETNPICAILCDLFHKEGVPMILQSDNGGEFVSRIIKFVMPKLGIKLINGSPYSPTSQGQIERFNKTLKLLLKKEIQIEMSKSNTLIVENWSKEILPKIMDIYVHNKHRSLSRTPWELYYARSSPHPLKSVTHFDSFSPSFVESCSYPQAEAITSFEGCNLTNEIIVRANIKERMDIQTLTQTRKVQVENNRKIIKRRIPNQKLEVGMIAYMRNPNISGKKRKKNLQECLNVRAKILKIHSTSNQYYVQYENFQKDKRHKWVHYSELYTHMKPEIKDLSDFLCTDSIVADFSHEFNRTKYNNLLIEFEKITAENWCNTRNMIRKFLQNVCENDKCQFDILDERYSKRIEQGESEMNFYRELLSEVLDNLFIEFCASSFEIDIDKTSESNVSKLKYMAHRGFKEYIGVLQIWYQDRMVDKFGSHFGRTLQILDPSTIHRCEECSFSDHCTHDCCFSLLKNHYDKQLFVRNVSIAVDDVKDTSPTNSSLYLGKRTREIFDQNSELLADLNNNQQIKCAKYSESDSDNFCISIPLKLINYPRNLNSLGFASFGDVNEHSQVQQVKESEKILCKRDSFKSKRTKSYFVPVDKEWRKIKCQ